MKTMENFDKKDNIERLLKAVENPADYEKASLEDLMNDDETKELYSLLSDIESVNLIENKPKPDVDVEWSSFARWMYRRRPLNIHGKRAAVQYISLFVSSAAIILFVLFIALPIIYGGSSKQENRFIASLIENGSLFFVSDTMSNNEVSLSVNNGRMLVSVPRGKSYKTQLPDGTIVVLNTDSRLEYYTDTIKQRRVAKLCGEAFMKVAPDSLLPFIVETDDLNTKVLGTVLSVRSYKDEPESVTLMSGAVDVSQKNSDNAVRLYSDYRLTYDGEILKLDSSVIARDYVFWADGEFYYNNVRLDEMLRDIARWYNMSVVITDKELPKKIMPFTASRSESIENVLRRLKERNGVDVRIVNNCLYI